MSLGTNTGTNTAATASGSDNGYEVDAARHSPPPIHLLRITASPPPPPPSPPRSPRSPLSPPLCDRPTPPSPQPSPQFQTTGLRRARREPLDFAETTHTHGDCVARAFYEAYLRASQFHEGTREMGCALNSLRATLRQAHATIYSLCEDLERDLCTQIGAPLQKAVDSVGAAFDLQNCRPSDSSAPHTREAFAAAWRAAASEPNTTSPLSPTSSLFENATFASFAPANLSSSPESVEIDSGRGLYVVEETSPPPRINDDTVQAANDD